jgi:hypothetical protein
MSATCTSPFKNIVTLYMPSDPIPHPDNIKEPETGAVVNAYFFVSVGQTVGIFYSW